jgi:anti-sigma factor RsiW
MSDAASRLSEAELAELCALADGTLPAERRSAVEARVAASPELQLLLERQRRAVAATHALASEPVPASLRDAVEARGRSRSAPRGWPRWLGPRVAVAGALAVAIVVAAAVVLTGGPGAPTVAEAARFAADPPSEPAPQPVGDDVRLAIDVEGVVFPDLARSYGWRAVGVRRGTIDGRSATTVVYEQDGRQIAYVVVSGSSLPRPSSAESTTLDGVLFQTLRVDDRLVVTWRRLGHTCVLVGAAVPRSELLTLASWRGDGTLPY